MPRRKIAVITESRADYGIQLPVLKAIQDCPELELNLIVTGMHLLKEHGETWREIHNDGFAFQSMEFAPLTACIDGSDWLIVLGDRMPHLEAAIEATKLGIPIAHIQGGDVTSGACIDEQAPADNVLPISRMDHNFPDVVAVRPGTPGCFLCC